MKLLRRLERMEAGKVGRLTDVGIAWSAYDAEIERELESGEYVAVDVVEVEMGQGTVGWRCTERVTRDEADMGIVLDAAGAEIGRVTGRHGNLVSVEYSRDGTAATTATVEAARPSALPAMSPAARRKQRERSRGRR